MAIMKHLETLFFLLQKNPYLTAVRSGLTLAIPLVITATLAIFISNIPSESYIAFMTQKFGAEWRTYCQYIYNGTFGIFSLIMVTTISYSLAEDCYNTTRKIYIPPSLLAITSLSALFILTEPWSILVNDAYTSVYVAKWFGAYGLFLAIAVTLLAAYLFHLFATMSILNIRFYCGSTSATMTSTMNTLLPTFFTLCTFGLIKILFISVQMPDIHATMYRLLILPFAGQSGEPLSTALLLNGLRHITWFFGVHGANIFSPAMAELYTLPLHPALGGDVLPLYLKQVVAREFSIFSRPFFDTFTTMGGAGATLGLVFACLLFHKDKGIRRITHFSILPSFLNINEILLFGLPVVLNPTFLIPFILVPLVCTLTSELAILLNIVPLPTRDVSWNMPILFNAYTATGSVAGCLLQIFNITLATAIYAPFVILDSKVQHRLFKANFKDFTAIACGSPVDNEQENLRLLNLPHPLGAIAHDLTRDMQNALNTNEIFLQYQPQVNSNTGRVYGIESLIRWRHPHIGMIPPPVLIGLAEDTGFIEELGLWSFEHSIIQLAQWQKLGVTNISMSINVSSKQLGDSTLPSKMLTILEEYEVPVSSVKLELTETAALTPSMLQNNVLKHLSEKNFTIAIDDFGMGHSSITYLKKFNVSAIKLDALLTRDVLVSRNSCQIIRSIIELADGLDISVIAEFVEDEAHLLRLRSLGCHNIQGYFYSPALNPDSCLEFISAQHRTYGALKREDANQDFSL